MHERTSTRLDRRKRRPQLPAGILLAIMSSLLLATVLFPTAASEAAGASTSGTGFSQPFAGTLRYQSVAASQIEGAAQLNQPIGQHAADLLAKQLGLSRADALTPAQYVEFITGGGRLGDKASAELIDESVRIFTNTVGRPLYYTIPGGSPMPTTLASYGLWVTPDGELESLANEDAPTRQVNAVIAPTKYMGIWLRANGATATLNALYRSAYPVEAAFGFKSQEISGRAQLVSNELGGTRSTVGMSMVPCIWLVNFILLYVLNPSEAALMPAHWAPIPAQVATAIEADPNGKVSFNDYASYFSSATTN